MSEDLKTEISDAIGAHGMWKKRLKDAAISAERGLPVDDICRDDRCKFGKWLLSTSPDDVSRDHFEGVRRLHAEFHKKAGEVAGMIRDGKDDVALAALETGAFRDTSTKLVIALTNWRRAVET